MTVEEWVGAFRFLAPPPSRTETIKHGWSIIRDDWSKFNRDGRLELVHDLGIVDSIMYEQIRYGDQWVIEAEGVVVERLAAK